MNSVISDIQEKEATVPTAPSFPQIQSTTTGFPEHKKRTRISAFRQKRQDAQVEREGPQADTTSSEYPFASSTRDAHQTSGKDFKSGEKGSIDRENTARLDSMSPEAIQDLRQELFSDLDPSILEMLLKRATLDQPKTNDPFDLPESASQDTTTTDLKPAQDPPTIVIDDTSVQPNSSAAENKAVEQGQAEPTATNSSKRVRWASVADEEDEDAKTIPETQPVLVSNTTSTNNEVTPDSDTTPNLPPTESPANESSQPKPHWPHPPQSGDLDLQDPDFLSKLHAKYFPQLPADPSKLAWMAPLPTPNSTADFDSPYHPYQSSLSVSSLRFDFRGQLLAPRISRAVPSTKGLHHHGEAPEAAGYTVKELARLCRSAVPGQRCVAYQTLGRLLYRLGRGQYGGVHADVARGVWDELEEGSVLWSLYEEAGKEEGQGHRSARAFAVEAIWLYEKGGWAERLRRGKT
ncbi:hypothetical protein F4781DRAFT_406571 [Annulohypoxylon bovei var. microspora]|nr:hypothetical protein F4781DRAFT_406571 [Annulohypoxylon bovei var. microspora]